MIRKLSAEEALSLQWFKSSYSSGSEGDSCVEIATFSEAVHVRDSKDVQGPQIAVAPSSWVAFVTYTSAG